MFLKTRLSWNVIIRAEELSTDGLSLQKAIIVQLLDDFAAKKAMRDLGHFLAVTTLERIGEGKIRQNTGDVLFPVEFSCITFKMFRGEVLEGVVYRILKHGVFLICGPVDKIYLSQKKMMDYEYVPGENPTFRSKSSIIDKGVVLRFKVIGEKYVETEGDFQAVVGLNGHLLGPK